MSASVEYDLDSSFSDMENYCPSKTNIQKASKNVMRKPAAASKAKSKAKKIVESSDDDDDAFDVEDESPIKKSQVNRRTSMERNELTNRYQKKTQLEHIMLRPDTYIGSTERITQEMWVFENNRMVFRPVTYTPGLYKIFDEILVNAIDNKQRDTSMKYIKVSIDEETGEITVSNDGKGIPVEIHQEHHIYIPELIFGHLMTGENFEDTDQRVVGGRNGYGAKLANIFSSEFSVETNDSKSGKRYVQVWTNNMQSKREAQISKASGKDFTTIKFTPDYARFGMPDGIDKDIISLFKKRVYDAAGTTDKSVKVYLNDMALKVSGFEQYIDLYMEPRSSNDDVESEGSDFDDDDKPAKGKKKKTDKTPVKKIYEKVNERWEVCIMASPDAQMQQVSFVNGICTTKGGQHVNYIADQIATRLQEIVKKKHKGSDIKAHQIKAQLWIFVNSLIVNPAFDSQTKENLTTRHPKFGPKEMLPKLSDKAMKQLEKTEIVSNILYWAKAKDMKDLSRMTAGGKKSKLKGIDKLDDANNAGTKLSERCTLILTEGDSAKTLAISGLSVVGRDNYGVFPLRGKLLNVRDASNDQIKKNEEIQNITKILGLQIGKTYTSTKDLRYGHLMIMTDQDHDGSHIKGLIMNFLQHFWPSLLKIPGFLRVFITPIVKVSRKIGGGDPKAFYTLPQYEAWSKQLPDAEKSKWAIKYYKGLGTSTSKEAKEYFADLKTHQIDMEWEGDVAGEVIDMAFSKKRVDDRKEWLNKFVKGTFMDFDVKAIKYKDFVNRELILFSMADLARSIPSVVDGMKPSQRKVLFGCLRRNLKSDIKVAQLVGYISEHAAYHHGEVSLANTVVGMAQSYVGSNNVNLLFPSGQFGSRILGGKDAASPRYIFTRLGVVTRQLFHQNDDAILNYLAEDGQTIEPDYYVPIIPMLLVNGASGIGTGWSTDVPCFNPRDLVDYLRQKLNGGESQYQLVPWYRGFSGTIEPENHAKKGFTGRYRVCGDFERDDVEECLTITELPIGSWTQPFKQFLTDEKVFPEGFFKEIRENHTDTSVHFTLYLSSEAYKSLGSDADIRKKFHLETTIGVTNMTAFGADGVIKQYVSAEEIADEFYDIRLGMYVRRKDHIVNMLEREWSKLDNKARFVQMVIDGSIVITKRKRKELLQELAKKGFEQFSKTTTSNDEENDDDVANADVKEVQLAKGYDYLLSMPLWSLTAEKVEKLLSQRDEKFKELETLRAKRPEDLWEEDLDALLVALDKQDELDREEEVLHKNGGKKGQILKAKPVPKPRPQIKRLPAPVKKSVKVVETPDTVEIEESDDEPLKEIEILPLAERLRLSQKAISPQAPAMKRSKGATPISVIKSKPIGKKPRTKAEKEKQVDELASELSTLTYQEKPKSKPQARVTKSRKKVVESSDEDDDEVSAIDLSVVTPPKPRAVRQTKAKKVVYSDEDSEEEAELDSEDEFEDASELESESEEDYDESESDYDC